MAHTNAYAAESIYTCKHMCVYIIYNFVEILYIITYAKIGNLHP